MVDVIPGVLEKEWKPIEEKLLIAAPHVSWIQVDIADNTLVPNTTLLDFTNINPTKLLRNLEHLSFEAHLMVANPEKYIKPLADAGFKRLIAHVECHDPRLFLDQAKYEHVEVGMAIDGPTEFEQIEPFLDQIDVVLVMTIEAGFSGQEFMTETLEKIKTIHENYPDLPIEVDGGINAQTGKIARDAGVTRLVSTSFLFKHPDNIAQSIAVLKGE
jgi:ribulose-phosphate 3-epimerase